jgi:hypothetical protein
VMQTAMFSYLRNLFTLCTLHKIHKENKTFLLQVSLRFQMH